MAKIMDTLLVRHLPGQLSSEDCEGLLKHFGAKYVRYMGTSGCLKNCAFAKFEDVAAAKQGIQRLHQLEVLGSRLVVVYSSESFQDHHPSVLEKVKTKQSVQDSTKEIPLPVSDSFKEKEVDKKVEISQQINSISSKWGINYPFNPKLKYAYPAPTICILTNIANALATVPRFYVQVLHLMNKMNLPAPFGLQTSTPPMPLGTSIVPPPPPSGGPETTRPPEPDILETEDMAMSSAEESELESEGESNKRPVDKVAAIAKRKRERKKLTEGENASKRLKLQLRMQTQLQSVLPPGERTIQQNPSDVFEAIEPTAGSRKIELKLPTDDNINSVVSSSNLSEETVTVGDLSIVEVGGFGRLEPDQTLKSNVAKSNSGDEDSDTETEFISSRELLKGIISQGEIQKHSAFKNYDAGEPSSRLYIKNLAKQTTEKDLHRIYGRYVNWSDEAEKTSFYKQLMTSGRMKGQAFVTLPNEEKTKRALAETNGFMLHGKPMVVSFARSAKATTSAAQS